MNNICLIYSTIKNYMNWDFILSILDFLNDNKLDDYTSALFKVY